MFSGFLVCHIHGDLILTDDLQDVLHHCVLIDKPDNPGLLLVALASISFLYFPTSSMLANVIWAKQSHGDLHPADTAG